MITFHSNGNERNVSSFNVVKTEQFCSLHFHEEENPREWVQYNEAFEHLYILHHYKTIYTGQKFYECYQCGKAFMLWDPLSSNTIQKPGQLKWKKNCRQLATH